MSEHDDWFADDAAEAIANAHRYLDHLRHELFATEHSTSECPHCDATNDGPEGPVNGDRR